MIPATSAEKPATREMYGATPFGQGALAARRLVEAGVRFATVSFGGWDTAGNAPFSTWRDALYDVSIDHPEGRGHGWLSSGGCPRGRGEGGAGPGLNIGRVESRRPA
ncbi:MAG: DUF1501 domain-containing protein [Rhodospirillales bacterium]|nr:DUF1501 domain-containing protein [Rhodospirillales bacterium]